MMLQSTNEILYQNIYNYCNILSNKLLFLLKILKILLLNSKKIIIYFF